MSTNYYLIEREILDDDTHYSPLADGGLFLGKRAGGWEPYFQWHEGCRCCWDDDDLPYRNFGELAELVLDPDYAVIDEYGKVFSGGEWLDMMVEWKEENHRSHANQYPRDAFRIDGWDFVRGCWS